MSKYSSASHPNPISNQNLPRQQTKPITMINAPTRTSTIPFMQPTVQDSDDPITITPLPTYIHNPPETLVTFPRKRRKMQENFAKEMERQSDGTFIKKGPWTAEEDEILNNFVNKYGPRDWSSIRSKGLLPRTGKSCRLRWVNKLRPNLKTCKFTAEEERIVIELQAQFGNKWAKIATYLPGRTDNDVKNFWSTRRKRLERMLQSPSPKLQRNNNGKTLLHAHAHHEFAFLEVNESSSVSADTSCNTVPVTFPEFLLRQSFPSPPAVDPAPFQIQLLDYESAQNYPFSVEPQLDMTMLPDCHLFLDRFEEELPLGDGGMENPSTPDSFFEDFPDDMFDHLESLPSPSGW